MRKIDDLTFNAMYSVLQNGMWLLNDLEAYLRPLDMSQAKLSILLAVAESKNGVVSPHEIALITGKSRPAITRTMERLAGQSIVSISTDSLDGRRKKLSLTGKGRDLLDQIIPEYNRRILAMSRDLSESDKEWLIRLLGKITYLDEKKASGGII